MLKIKITSINADIVVKEVTHLITVLREKMIWDIDKTMIQPVMKMKVLRA